MMKEWGITTIAFIIAFCAECIFMLTTISMLEAHILLWVASSIGVGLMVFGLNLMIVSFVEMED
jgi:hypothetical protein